MTSRAIIGQTVVTDPTEGRSSGYVLVAASPSVQPADAQHLSVAPQVTDYLHLESSPGPFFSFYPLPSGCWALVKRFVRGTRRGAFNRVVVHALITPREVLEEVCEEPWLLLTKCRFRAREGGPERTPAELSDLAGNSGLESLEDLECLLPPDPRTERYALLSRRREFLRKRWGDPELVKRLASVFAALAADRRVLLPQEPEAVELVALSWSALPVADRLAAPWTTHLAPAAGSLFRLANAPDPEEVRSEQQDPEQWILPLGRMSPPDPAGGGGALAQAIVAAEPEPEDLHAGFRRYSLSLLTGSARIRRWIAWLRRGGPDVLRGLADENALADLLHEFRLDAGGRVADPWLSPTHFLCCACGSILRLHRQGRAIDQAIAAVDRVLVDTHWRDSLLDPAVIAELTELDDGELAAQATPVAVALALRDFPPPPRRRGDRETLLRLLLAAPPIQGARAEEHPLLTPVLVELGVALARCGSSELDDAFGRLATLPGGLSTAVGELGGREDELPLMLAILRAARWSGDPGVAARVAVEYLFPLVDRSPDLVAEVPEAELTYALRALRQVPAVLASLVVRASDVLFDAAVAELHHWARNRWRQARQVAEKAARKSRKEPIRVRPAVRGLAESLAQIDTPAHAWLPFALAEAALSETNADADRFARFLHHAEVGEDEAREVADAVLDAVRRAISTGELEEGHRLLVGCVRSGLAAQAEKTVAVLAELSHLPTTTFLRWGETVRDVADAMDAAQRKQEASRLRANWWQALATRQWPSFPQAVLPMLEALGSDDKWTLAESWMPRIAQLGTLPGEKELMSRLAKVAGSDPEHQFKYNVGVLAARLNLDEIKMEEAVAQADRLARRSPDRRRFLIRALRTLLPGQPRERVHAVVSLLVSARLLPSIKRILEVDFRDPTLELAGDELAASLPAVEALAARGNLLLRIASQLGRRWIGDPAGVEDFLRQADRLGRFDAIAACLRVAEASRESLLERLALAGDRSLFLRIGKAAGRPASARFFRPFAGRIHELQSDLARRRR